MKKKNKFFVAFTFGLLLTIFMSLGIAANAEYDENGNYYEQSSETTQISQTSTSSLDTSVLTSDDWSKVQQNLNSTFKINSAQNGTDKNNANNDFKSIKEDSDTSNDINDTWIYLLLGLVCLTLGVIAAVFVIANTIHSKHSAKQQTPRHSLKIENKFDDEVNISKKSDKDNNEDTDKK